MRFKQILILGLLGICVLAALPMASAAMTYNVTTLDDLWNVSKLTQVTPGMDIVIDVKSDLVGMVQRDIIFDNATVLINGNNKNITFKFMSSADGLKTVNSTLQVKNLNFRNTSFNASCGLINATGSTQSTQSVVVVDSCLFENNDILNGNLIYSTSNYGAINDVKVTNCTFLNNNGTLVRYAGNIMGTGDKFEMKDVLIRGGFNGSQCWVGIDNTDNVLVENVTISGRGTLGPAFLIQNDKSITLSNITVENVTADKVFYLINSSAVIKNSYVGDNVCTDMILASGTVIVDVIQCTFYNNTMASNRIILSVNNAPGLSGKAMFCTLVKNGTAGFGFVTEIEQFGNVISRVPGQNVTNEKYEDYFGTNQPALNGGKTKSIQLSDKEENPALNKISVADYQSKMGINPNSDIDQSGKKRIYGSAVDYGSIELQKNPIQTIIDGIIDLLTSSKPKDNNSTDPVGSDDSGLFSKTKPSMVLFLFGDDPFLKRTQSLLYFIVSNWVKMDVPVVSDVSRGFINVVGWES